MNSARPNAEYQKVAVTGATGYLAAHLVGHLVGRGHSVVGLSRSAHPVFDHSLYSHRMVNYSNPNEIERSLRGCTVVVHLAGIAHTRSPDAEGYRKAILETTKNLSKAAGEVQCRRFIYASTVGVFGANSYSDPLNEESSCCPASAYGEYKLAAEEFLIGQSSMRSADVVIFRMPPLYSLDTKNSFSILNLSARKKIPHH